MKNLINRMKLIAQILSLLGLSSCALHPPGIKLSKLAEQLPPERRSKPSILFIGNSYSFGVPQALRDLSISNGKNVKIAASTFGGWTLQQHSTDPRTLKKLRKGNWDIIVIQDHSLHPGSPKSEREKIMNPFVKFFANEARAIGAIPILYQTWGRRDGDFRIPGDDFYAMNKRIRTGSHEASEYAGGITIVPAGDAWEHEYRNGNGTKLYQADGSHPSTFGDQVTTLEFYKTIFGSYPTAHAPR